MGKSDVCELEIAATSALKVVPRPYLLYKYIRDE